MANGQVVDSSRFVVVYFYAQYINGPYPLYGAALQHLNIMTKKVGGHFDTVSSRSREHNKATRSVSVVRSGGTQKYAIVMQNGIASKPLKLELYLSEFDSWVSVDSIVQCVRTSETTTSQLRTALLLASYQRINYTLDALKFTKCRRPRLK